MDWNVGSSSSHRRKTRSSERRAISPTRSDNNRKRPRTHSEPSFEKVNELHSTKEFPDKEGTLPSETFINAEPLPKPNEDADTKLTFSGESVFPDSTADSNDELVDNRGQLFQKLFKDVVSINADFEGNDLYIIGSLQMAERIEKKFVIMQKLANLVGCGLDCHFRLAHGDYRLMMMVRGAPRVVFGTTVLVVPDLTNTRKYATPGEFVEAAQIVFFDSILTLVPRNLIAATPVLSASFMKGEEDSKVKKLYEFLKNIRTSVLSSISTIPIVWTVPDFPSKNEDHLDIVSVRNVLKQCADTRLLKLEADTPGFTNMFCSICGLGPAQTFEQMMDLKFNDIKMV